MRTVNQSNQVQGNNNIVYNICTDNIDVFEIVSELHNARNIIFSLIEEAEGHKEEKQELKVIADTFKEMYYGIAKEHERLIELRNQEMRLNLLNS